MLSHHIYLYAFGVFSFKHRPLTYCPLFQHITKLRRYILSSKTHVNFMLSRSFLFIFYYIFQQKIKKKRKINKVIHEIHFLSSSQALNARTVPHSSSQIEQRQTGQVKDLCKGFSKCCNVAFSYIFFFLFWQFM